MSDLEKYEAVNATVNLTELAKVIESFADKDGMIQDRSRKFNAKDMAERCRNFKIMSAKCLTKSWGIRQQALMLV